MRTALIVLSSLLLQSGQPITLDVVPKVVTTNPYKVAQFRVRIRIVPHPDNREFSYFASCGGRAISSIREVDREVYTYFESFVVLQNCEFQVCLSRVGWKYPVCEKQEVRTPEEARR